MTKNDIAKLCFKLLAVYFVMQIFFHCENIVAYLLHSDEMAMYQKANFVAAILPPILFVIFGIVLWFVSPYLANAVFKPNPDDKEIPVTINNFHSVAFSVAGLYLLMISLSAIIEFIVFNHAASGRDSLNSWIVIASLKIAIGIWLILGSKGIVNAIQSLRRE